MKNPLMNGNGGNAPQMPNINALFAQFKKNPMEFLLKSKLNIPQNVGSSPQAIVEHLMKSGQVPNQLIPQVQRLMGGKNG